MLVRESMRSAQERPPAAEPAPEDQSKLLEADNKHEENNALL